ncbi:hypothetical protein QJS04_geneDACA008435 [Acorus gramineus]|uniref:Uncharacterized protein n=1 Tax=Acorus gramineus TaxID=55184 RepID=A0AAV9AIQ4_ACOGR|nr:hypothetical protein QJS04_geneDACA008435 [Acorus gramineus]
MWQVSGSGWGRLDRDSAVDSMLRLVDVGLSTFDMADICKKSFLLLLSSLFLSVIFIEN